MEIAEILEELSYDSGHLPREAIEAAVVHREAITPHLLKILEQAAEHIGEIIEHDNYQGHLFAMYLLAQFREKRAYPLILRLFSFPGETPHAIAGDVLTEDLGRLFACVCGKNLQPIEALIENRLVNEYVRAAGLSCLVTLVGVGEISRKDLIDYFASLLISKLEKHSSFVWDHLIACCLELFPDELIHPIEEAYKQGLINSSFIPFERVQALLTDDKEAHLLHFYQNAELIEDTVSEMEKWLTPHL